MNPSALLGLLGRRAMVITLALLAFLAVDAICLLAYIGESVPPIYFAAVVSASTFALLLSFGGFLGKAITDLGRLQLARTIPGLRRQLLNGIGILVPVVAAGATVFLALVVPRFSGVVHPVTLWCLLTCAITVGISLGGYWVILMSFTVLIPGKAPWILGQIHTSPVAVSGVALAASALMLALRFRRYLTPQMPAPSRNSIGTTAPLADGLLLRRKKTLPDGPDWSDRAPGVSLGKLVRAGIYERLGGNRGRLWGKMAVWVAVVYNLFGFVLYEAGRQKGFTEFARQVFAAEHPHPVFVIIFASITGFVAYICAVSIDTSPIPRLWHPISRKIRSRVIFRAHLQQNLTFAVIHLVGSLLMIGGIARAFDVTVPIAVVMSFAMPAMLAFLLMPVAQAIFPNGPEVFHQKVNPLTQLLGGLVGGLFCLLLTYWANYWPVKGLHAEWSLSARITLLAGAVLAVYAAYFYFLRSHYARADLRPRD